MHHVLCPQGLVMPGRRWLVALLEQWAQLVLLQQLMIRALVVALGE